MVKELIILRLLKRSKKIGFCFILSLSLCSCSWFNKHDETINHNKNGLSEPLEQIIDCFVKEYNIQGKKIYIYEEFPINKNKIPFPYTNIEKHALISITVYDDIPVIIDDSMLYSSKLNDYNLLYAVDKDKEMSISNNLIWKRIEPSKHNINGIPIIIDYVQTYLLYNKEENIIELSSFKSESCKGRFDGQYEW